MKTYQQDYAVGKPYGNIYTVNRNTSLEYRKGTYIFWFGIIDIYCEDKNATFSFVHKGRVYSMTISEIKKPLTDRQLITKASKFGREVILKNK